MTSTGSAVGPSAGGPSAPPSGSTGSTPVKAKRITACLHCRRQKLKCDVGTNNPCTRCKQEGAECVVRPRANAAILTDDLRWQQSVETRFQAIQKELEVLRNNQKSSTTLGNNPFPTPGLNTDGLTGTPLVPPSAGGSAGFGIPPPNPIFPPLITLPDHLVDLRNVLAQSLRPLQAGVGIPETTPEEAALLWESFYTSLAIYHGFVAGLTVTAPSPLLLTAIAAASAARSPDPVVRARHPTWVQLFQRALNASISGEGSKSWDDPVALCIARTWFWKGDSTTTGLIYGSFLNILSPATADLRSRRVWDFIQITIFSHNIFHLGPTIIPDRAPDPVPPRQYPHVLFGALTELFDLLGVLPRALVTATGLVEGIIKGRKDRPWSYAESSVLKTCIAEIHKWGAKWSAAIHATANDRLPGERPKEFLLDLVAVYYQAGMLIVNGYLQQGTEADIPQYKESARDVVELVVNTWSQSLSLWPKVLLDAALLGTMILDPNDPLSLRAYNCLSPLSHIFEATGNQLFAALQQRFQSTPNHDTAKLLMQSFDPSPMLHTGSDSFWDDLLGSLQVEPDPSRSRAIGEMSWS